VSPECAHLRIGQSGVGAVGVAAMPEACEGDVFGQTSHPTNATHLCLDVAHRIAPSSHPRQMYLFARIRVVPHHNQRPSPPDVFKARHHLRPQLGPVIIEQWNSNLLGFPILVVPGQNMVGLDGIAFIGSANASNRSAGQLTEAVVRTPDKIVVRSARAFVRSLCRDELSPERLAQLQKLYRPPRVPGGNKKIQRLSSRNAVGTLPRLFLAQLKRDDPPEGSELANEAGLTFAKTKQQHKRAYVLTDYFRVGKNIVRKGDKVIQVLEEVDGRILVDAPGDVVHTRVWRSKERRVTFIYLEHPDVRRIGLDDLARRLGQGAKKKLNRDGMVRDRKFAEKLLAHWSRF
jgi:hypothetical protein